MEKSRVKHIVFYIISFLAALPFASAARSGIPGLDKGIEAMSGLFYPSTLLRNENVQVGFFKFLYFLIVFAAVNWVLTTKVFKDDNGKRASGVIAFAFAAISAWFMPVRTALGMGGFITALFTLLLPLSITGAVIYFSFGKLNKEWWHHLIGLLLIIFNIIILSWLMGVIA